MVTVNKSGTDQRIPLWNLTLYNVAPQRDQHHSELKNQVPPPYTKENLATMPKAHLKSSGADEDDIHGYINPEEARAHVEALEKLMTKIKDEVEKPNTSGLLDTVLADLKEILSNLTPTMQLADISTVSKAIHDKNYNVLLPKSDTIDQILEEIILSEDIPEAPEVLKTTQKEGKMSQEDQKLVAELFSNLEVAHNHATTACGLLSRLSRTLKPEQLLTIVRATTRPLIQLSAPTALETLCKTKKTQELPDEQFERVRILLTPDPRVTLLQKEKPNSVTRLFAATYSYKIFNKFGPGTTQRGLQEIYQVKAKQLDACITGRKYLGGVDRKRKVSGSDEGAPSSKKPSSSQ